MTHGEELSEFAGHLLAELYDVRDLEQHGKIGHLQAEERRSLIMRRARAGRTAYETQKQEHPAEAMLFA